MRQKQDHPRGCGENVLFVLVVLALPGSPPRMRGKQCLQCAAGYVIRITPADAGKTFGTRNCGRSAQDHPRGCGENDSTALKAEADAGSPPRMRGKPYRMRAYRECTRITPADAGKTCRKQQPNRPGQDHPRGCGENTLRYNRKNTLAGSPPRMRGKLSLYAASGAVARITPADAGKTSPLQ